MDRDKINDRMDGMNQELLQEYMESDKGIKEFINWLWDASNDKLREDLLEKFSQSEDGKNFRDWAWRSVENGMQRPDDDSKGDR